MDANDYGRYMRTVGAKKKRTRTRAVKEANPKRFHIIDRSPSGDVVSWEIITIGVDERLKDAHRAVYICALESGRCPMCHGGPRIALTVVALPPPMLAEQPDGTTHVCHPGLGGCGHGFEDTRSAK